MELEAFPMWVVVNSIYLSAIPVKVQYGFEAADPISFSILYQIDIIGFFSERSCTLSIQTQ